MNQQVKLRLPLTLPIGPAMLDVAGLAITNDERTRLAHPLVGGVILFARNYRDREQLTALCAEIHSLRSPQLLIAIDHEGGRVQRCREGFTRLPAMRQLGHWWDTDPAAACAAAKAIGVVLAVELRDCGVDLSFTPVLDLDWGTSGVIGDRAFHHSPEGVVALAGALIDGLKLAGMSSCGKHFPGHGWVKADSHVAIPIDEREFGELVAVDMAPFKALPLGAVMPAHVIYPKIDQKPAGFSSIWHRILREQTGFQGVVFSDDLSMEGASSAGDIVGRASAAWEAGCDMVLVCNAPDQADYLLATWTPVMDAVRSTRVAHLLPTDDLVTLKKNPALDTLYQAGLIAIANMAA
jgi:beta-N-acetylhexosaminidase